MIRHFIRINNQANKKSGRAFKILYLSLHFVSISNKKTLPSTVKIACELLIFCFLMSDRIRFHYHSCFLPLVREYVALNV